MQEFKILTLNMHKGFSMGNRRFTLETIRDNLRESGSNLVFLQEVTGENERHRKTISDWPENNQMEYLADTVWDHFAYGKNAIYQHGHHGNAILSEYPFAEFSNLNITTYRFSQRGILHGILDNGIHLLCAHLGLIERERRQQVDKLITYIDSYIPDTEPLILAGDFNDWRRTIHRKLKASCNLIEASEHCWGQLPATYPALVPMLPMDRIYLRGFQIHSTQVMNNSAWRQHSDHCAIVANVTLMPR